MSTAGSLASDIAAIYVRDYWKVQRKRWIPQLTVNEMIIVFTLVSVIIIALTTLSVLRP